MARSADGTTVAAVFDPARLTLARQAAGWSKKELAVSVAALLYRCRELGTLSEASYKRAMMRISRLGWRTHEPGENLPVERPALLTRAFDLAASTGVTIGTLADTLQLPAAKVRTLLGMTDDPPVLQLVPSS